MLGFIKKCFSTAITFINFNLSNVNSLECFSMNNQECKIRAETLALILTLMNLCFILIVLK